MICAVCGDDRAYMTGNNSNTWLYCPTCEAKRGNIYDKPVVPIDTSLPEAAQILGVKP